MPAEERECFISSAMARWPDLESDGQPLGARGPDMGASLHHPEQSRVLMEREKLGFLVDGSRSACHGSVTGTGTASQGSFNSVSEFE